MRKPLLFSCLAAALLSLAALPAGAQQPVPAPAEQAPAAVTAPTEPAPSTATAAPVAEKKPARSQRLVPDDTTKVYLFLDPVAVEAPPASHGDDLAAVLTRLTRTRLNALESVRLKTYQEMPEVPEIMARFGELEQLDRVSLIAIKNITGFDGLVRAGYRYEEDKVELQLTCFDFRNGRVFRQRKLAAPIGAELFQVVESDLTEFAVAVRRSYRVTLDVDSQPDKSQVSINGQPVGTTPLLHELTSGEYTIRVEQEGYKPFEKTYQLSDGDRLHLDTTLYNPLAARFLNAEPGFRVDSRELDLGYRYVYLDMDRPGVTAAHFFVLSWLMRFSDWDVGVRWASSIGLEGENRLDTFLGKEEGLQRYDILLEQFLAVVKYALLEKYSFATVRLGLSSGMTLALTDDGARDLTRWSFSGALFAELASRLFRAGNFSMEAELDLGVAYLGQLPYTERTFSLFGEMPAEEKSRAMIGPMASLSLRMVFWNDIF